MRTERTDKEALAEARNDLEGAKALLIERVSAVVRIEELVEECKARVAKLAAPIAAAYNEKRDQ